jgi:hypothetical protein
MSIKLIDHHLSSLIVLVKRSVIIESDFKLANQMKVLNDAKQFRKTLELFNKNKEKNNINTCSSSIIIQALKACSQLGDLQCGSSIHRLISSRIKNDSWILVSLINMYSQLKKMTFFSYFLFYIF